MSKSTQLKFHKNRCSNWARLPFVDRIEGKPGYNSWCVPRDGGYFGGCESGKALGMIYLKYLRENGRGLGGNLQFVVMDMCGLGFSAGRLTDEQDALKGQIVGFFTLLEDWLEQAVKHGGHKLDNLEEPKLLKYANHWLSVKDAEVNHESD